jgi:hypothetical protein
MSTIVKLLAGLALLGVTLATPATAQPGKRSIAKASTARTYSPRNSTGEAHSLSNPNVPTTICY